MSVLDRPDQIQAAKFFTLIAALKLEIAGLKMSRGLPSAHAMLKAEPYNFRGNKRKVLEAALKKKDEMMKAVLAENARLQKERVVTELA